MEIIKNKLNKSTSIGMINVGGVYTAQCFDKDGNCKWLDEFHNLVTSQGLQYMNKKFFIDSGYTAAWAIGLIKGPGKDITYSVNDTLVGFGSENWQEFIGYTNNNNRPTVSFGNATLGNPSVISHSSPASFIISVIDGIVAGAFLSTSSSGNAILFSEGNFTGGDKTVTAGDIINVTYTFTTTGG